MKPDGKRPHEKPRHEDERSPYAKPSQSGSCLYRLYYSFVCLTRTKQPVLEGSIAERMPEFLQEVCSRYEYELIGYLLRPHQVQVIVSAKPSIPPSEVVGNLKRATAHHVFENFPELESRLGKRSLWAEGYFAETLNWKQIEPLLKSLIKPAQPTAESEPKENEKEEAPKPREAPTKPRRLTPAVIDELLQFLLPVEQQVLTLLYGLRGERARSPEQVAIILCLQPEEVRRIEETAIQKLRGIAVESEPQQELAVNG